MPQLCDLHIPVLTRLALCLPSFLTSKPYIAVSLLLLRVLNGQVLARRSRSNPRLPTPFDLNPPSWHEQWQGRYTEDGHRNMYWQLYQHVLYLFFV